MAGLDTPEGLTLDGQDITDILSGQRKEHPPIFTMRGDEVRTVRKGTWKLFLKKPKFYRPVDLENWKDKRAPDGVTIIAPEEQATPGQYPGIRPEHMAGDFLLFNLSEDISEMKNRYDKNLEKVKALKKSYHQFIISIEEE